MKGLKPEHRGLMNRILNRTKKDVDDLRQVYKDNDVAQKQLDVYTGEHGYGEHFNEYRDALKSGDIKKQRQLEQWFHEHGYDKL